jgi:hypothetical protein
LLEIPDKLAGAVGLAVVSEPGYIWISTQNLIDREIEWEPESRFEIYNNEDKLLKPVTLSFQDIHLGDVLEVLSDNYEINFAWDYNVVQPKPKANNRDDASVMPNRGSQLRPTFPPGVTTDGRIAYINLRNIQLRDSLKVVLRPLGLTYIIDKNIIWVSSADRIQANFPNPDQLKSSSRIIEVLESHVGVVFEDIHVADLLEVLSDNYELNVVIDERAIAPKKYTLETYSYYYAPPEALCESCTPITDGMIRYINLKGVTLREAIVVLCRQLNLTYRIQDGTVIIGAPNAFNADAVPPEFLINPEDLNTLLKERGNEAKPDIETFDEPEFKPIRLEREKLNLVRILRLAGGNYKAQIWTGKKEILFGSGNALGGFKLLSVDPDKKCCTILDEAENESFELCVEQ